MSESLHFHYAKRRFVKTHALSLLGTTRLLSRSVGRIESIRHIGDKGSQEYRYYLMSFTDLSRFTEVARSHGAIENSQHWVLDVQFAEDANRARKDASASNLALIRRMALNVLRHNDHAKRSIRTRKILASINDDLRFSLIFGIQDPI